MHKYQLLRQRAEEFHVLLVEYAQKDADVAGFMLSWTPWYERIQRRGIRLPCYDCQLGIYFTNSSFSPLAKRYGTASEANPLGDAWEQFEIAMLDRLSSPAYLAEMRANGVEPEIFPEALPPPAEETPLPASAVAARPGGWRIWLHRIIFGNRFP